MMLCCNQAQLGSNNILTNLEQRCKNLHKTTTLVYGQIQTQPRLGSGESITKEWLNLAYRKAAAKLHPGSGGGQKSFIRLQQAKTILNQLFAS